MKTMLENMISVMVMMIIVFVFISILSIQFQSIKANNIMTSAKDALESSYYKVDEKYLNSKVDEGFFEINDLGDEKELVYYYEINLPFLSYSKQSNIIGISR